MGCYPVAVVILHVCVIHRNSLLLNQHNGDDAPQNYVLYDFMITNRGHYWNHLLFSSLHSPVTSSVSRPHNSHSASRHSTSFYFLVRGKVTGTHSKGCLAPSPSETTVLVQASTFLILIYIPGLDTEYHDIVFSFLLDLQAPARCSSQFSFHFLNVIITVIVCLATVVTFKPPQHAAYDPTVAEGRSELWAGPRRWSRKKNTLLLNYYTNHCTYTKFIKFYTLKH